MLRENDRFMVRRRGKKRRVLGMTCLVRVLIEREPRKRDIKEGVSFMGRVTLVTKSVTCKKKGHIQMMCKKFNEDLKRMRNLRDGGRNESESSGSVDLGFVGDDDYDGALFS